MNKQWMTPAAAMDQLRQSERGIEAFRTLTEVLSKWPFDSLDTENQRAVASLVLAKFGLLPENSQLELRVDRVLKDLDSLKSRLEEARSIFSRH